MPATLFGKMIDYMATICGLATIEDLVPDLFRPFGLEEVSMKLPTHLMNRMGDEKIWIPLLGIVFGSHADELPVCLSPHQVLVLFIPEEHIANVPTSAAT